MTDAREPSAGRVRPDGLQVDDNPVLQARIWTAQRIAWATIALIVLTALGGAMGQGGWLATHMLRADGIQATLPRVARADGRTERIDFLVLAPTAEVELILDAPLLEAFDVQAIHPAPLAARARDGGLALHLAGDATGPFIIRLDLQARRAGLAHGTV